MADKNCKFFEGCSAPLCPNLSDEQNADFIWYPDEGICRKRENIPIWVKQQRKIALEANPENHGYYFNLKMLEKVFRVTKSVKGLDPDMPVGKEKQYLRRLHTRYKSTKRPGRPERPNRRVSNNKLIMGEDQRVLPMACSRQKN